MKQDLKSRIPAAVAYVAAIFILTLSGQITSTILLIAFYFLSVDEFIYNSHKIKSKTLSLTIQLTFGVFSLIFCNIIGPLSLILFTVVFFTYNAFGTIRYKSNYIYSFAPQIAAFTYLTIPFTLAIYYTQHYSDFATILLGVFIILWLNDAGAYFVGKAVGKNKLIPSISPNKTIEGFIGGGVLGVLTALLLTPVFDTLSIQVWAIISIIIWLSGSAGDIVESFWKRQLNIKDSGTIMKGHGGFLDRLDSFIYAIPYAILFLHIFNHLS